MDTIPTIIQDMELKNNNALNHALRFIKQIL